MPKQFDADVLRQLADDQEIEIETRSASGKVHTTVIWAVVVDHDVYVRSIKGDQGRWYREVKTNPDAAAVRVREQRLPVHPELVTDSKLIDRVSDGYLRKYADSPFAQPSVSEDVSATTLRLEPA